MRKYRTDEHRAEEKKIRDTSRKHEERKVLEWKRERSNVLFGNEGACAFVGAGQTFDCQIELEV